MKNTFIEFIEKSIPNESQREGINRRCMMVQMVKVDIAFDDDLFYEILNWFLK